MWAIRRASVHLRNRGLSSGTGRISIGKSEIERCYFENCNAGIIEPQVTSIGGLLSSTRSYNTSSSSLKSRGAVLSFSSQAGADSSEEDKDDLEDGFSELESPLDTARKGSESDDDLSSKSDLSEEESILDDIQDVLETKIGGGKSSARTRADSEMTKAILAAPASSVNTVLNKWVKEGNEVTQLEVSLTMLHLRRRRMFVKALQLLEWLQSTKKLQFLESHYASRLDLIAKLRGIAKAEEYLKQIPDSFRDELVYRTLLANCVTANNVKKSEELFNKMKDLKFHTSCFSCNQLLLLYKKTDKKKIADVLLLMEKENIKPSLFTYQVLIDVKGQSKDIKGMEQIVETMKSEGLEPSTQIQASLARHYAWAGLKDKAESVLIEMEGGDISKNRWICQWLIPIYATLGKADEVERIWKVCEPNSRFVEAMAAIGAWGHLGNIEKAEAAFDKIVEKIKKPSSKHFNALLKVYTNHKMLDKGKDLVKRMVESGCTFEPLTWDAIVKLYVASDEVVKASSILEKAVKQSRNKPMFSTYLAVMSKYAERGDVHNAESIFLMMKRAGYSTRLQLYHTLLQAYINAKMPVYGFSDRMKADNMFPNKALAAQLARVDAFRKSPVDELLE
ncbi:hypothetical protein ABFS82_10G153300 [Erythranthe guttata]|uniref:Pentacotripeptide-repeat region of PRORP domain-containing protein n=1 Tax=Erythranthe guttata TaxID=4155 RepID=A0A022PSW8_ERYGU|nr:PREDICTED: pentatricopeptide repeat-containing protein At1g80270, mitochondrial-like [Erythranthe guttata]EYU18619.1 hypothetical protein MIMGU_mgv1a002981mg [Erythranthe guttata]|eukprot:XP_012828138.1 PREDICTED: pentatricopeptide repeat-containing protein At1g80270, mitochondrial-like [Erythranthe guttata]